MSEFEEILATRQSVWNNVAKQFSNVYNKYKCRKYAELLWGDELEYFLVSSNDPLETVTLSNIAESILKQTKTFSDIGFESFVTVKEACRFMLETFPMQPYSGNLSELGLVEDNITNRRRVLQGILPEKVTLLSLPMFPRFGSEFQDANFIERELISQNSYYKQALNGVMARAGEAFTINLPVFQDFSSESDQVLGNSPVLGVASTSLQVTMQATHLEDAQYLHDQLFVICPVLIALTAGAPVLRGFLLETDSRIPIISQTMDDRTSTERQPLLTRDGDIRHLSPRYGCVSWYISKDGRSFNDRKCAYNEDVYRKLHDDGVEESMAMHVAILCTREPLYQLESSVDRSTQYYDWLNGSTWPIVRLKIPQADGTIGWRVEIRPMGSQLTDFENAAFAVFVYLLSRALRDSSSNFLIPISKVQENYEQAWTRDAVRKGKFCFRSTRKDCLGSTDVKFFTIDEIINGNAVFCGLVPLIRQYLNKDPLCVATKKKVEKYLSLVSKTASGERPTVARKIREFVSRHPEYKHDSVVTEKIQYDLIKWLNQN